MSLPGEAELDAEALAVVPVRTATWSERDDGRVVVERTLPRARGVRGWLKLLSALTGVRRLRLDELGSYAWRRFDGETSVGDVARGLAEELEAPAEDAAGRLATFVRTLRHEGLLGLAGLDDEAIAEWRARAPADGPEPDSGGNL